MPVASCGRQFKNWLHPYDFAPRGKIGNRVLYRPPYVKNPNFFPVGDGFGFLVFIRDISYYILRP